MVPVCLSTLKPTLFRHVCYDVAYSYRIYVMTPMCLVEAIRAKEVRITDFSVLVLDECHNTQGGHVFANLMDLYMDIKFDNQGPSFSRLPQVISLGHQHAEKIRNINLTFYF